MTTINNETITKYNQSAEERLRYIVDNYYLKLKTKKERDGIDIEHYFLNPIEYQDLEDYCKKCLNNRKIKIKKYNKQYYEENKKKIQEDREGKFKSYYWKNREVLLAKANARYRAKKNNGCEFMKLTTFYDTIDE
jgi:hypothetical protein